MVGSGSWYGGPATRRTGNSQQAPGDNHGTISRVVARPVWDAQAWDRWLRDFFGPAATDGLVPPGRRNSPAAEIIRMATTRWSVWNARQASAGRQLSPALWPVSRLVIAANTATSTHQRPRSETERPHPT